MNIEAVLQQVDTYYSENRGPEAEELMLQSIETAAAENDAESLLQLLNELLGYYRETSQVEASYKIADLAIQTAEGMGLVGTLPHATTLLNVANAYRAGGRLEDSLALYIQVSEIYECLLSADNMLVASLHNNMSLLYQEMGKFAKAKESLLKALPIVEAKNAEFEVAVTYANLASTSLQLGEQEEACNYAKASISGFDKLGVKDAHYGAAISALATYHYQKGEYNEAARLFGAAMTIMEQNLGRNEYYYRLKENKEACETKSGRGISGLALSREYYDTCVKTMLEEKFRDYLGKIAVGLVGEGSDCFGYDDALSRDHDWGPDVCLWVTEETYEQIGEALEKAYAELPQEFNGYVRTHSREGMGRRGVCKIEDFYKRLEGSDASLAAAVNGEVFRDDEGIFTEHRRQLQEGYPMELCFRKIAQSAALFSQCAQYNYQRMKERGDELTASMMLYDGLKEAMKLAHYMEGKYPPHDKWLRRSLQGLACGAKLESLLQNPVQNVEAIGDFLARELYARNFISDIDSYLGAHAEELMQKAYYSAMTKEELVQYIANKEFEAFDKVQNVGGRASCQNDWGTFSIMRKSQYMTWNKTMLMQYLYDFERENQRGHNLITEKYGRMMESTARDEYEQMKDYFPELSSEKKAIIEEIVRIQVQWMEAFAAEYLNLAGNARSIRTTSDHLYNTSYETYLRGEISTYSDKMLELYGRFVVSCMKEEKNLAYLTMANSVRMYGYRSMEEAEAALQ